MGLLVFVLSLPEDFRLRLSHLARQKKTGRDATRAGLKELELAGYLTIRRERGERGKFSRVVWEVMMSPSAAKIDPDPPRSGNPNTGKPDTGKPASEKPTLTSTGSKQELNTKRTTTTKTTAPAEGSAIGVVVSLEDFKWPCSLGGAFRASAISIIQECPPEQRQAVLDEIAGLSDRGTVRHPIGLLRKLVDRAKHGQFVPAAALEYQRKLESQAKVAQSRLAEEQHRQQQSTPQAREKAMACVAALRQQFSNQTAPTKAKELT